ncbi:odorant receptor 22a-like isoform X2 [Leptopilina boulardi]|uniref:odorant receptor 22a-like isoform X2 n=1 Tax=Leptopilina boulardi TaxID=63433 RepID=UPI0021F5D761|nr:odorant receptor 22a-like isoform X2 [Leptopilina boulardi]
MANEKFEDYIYINKFYLIFIGLWPIQDNDALWKIYFHKFHLFTFTLCFWMLLLLPAILDIYIVWGNSYALIQNLFMTIHLLSLSLKFTHVAINQTVFKELLQMMKHNFDNSLCHTASDEEKEVMLKYARFGRLVTKIFLFCIYYFEIMIFCMPLIFGADSDPVRKKRYPIRAWYYWDQNSDFFYVIAYLNQVIVGLGLGVSYNLGMDTFVFVAIWHSCAQLRILQDQLRKVGCTEHTSQKLIEELIENHNYQIRNVKKLNQLFSTLCFYQLGTSLIGNCLGAFLMIVALEIGMAAYQSFWTNLPVKSTKSIFMIILRTHHPMMISAGGFYDMTLQNFTAIVKVNMSFLSVLRAMITK